MYTAYLAKLGLAFGDPREKNVRPVYDYYQGKYILFVQTDVLAASANTKYLIRRSITLPKNDTFTFKLVSDDAFELYIDCVRVKVGGYGTHTFTVNLVKGARDFILRYENIPDKTPGYIGFSLFDSTGAVVYASRASGWKGQVNSIGDIEWV